MASMSNATTVKADPEEPMPTGGHIFSLLTPEKHTATFGYVFISEQLSFSLALCLKPI